MQVVELQDQVHVQQQRIQGKLQDQLQGQQLKIQKLWPSCRLFGMLNCHPV